MDRFINLFRTLKFYRIILVVDVTLSIIVRLPYLHDITWWWRASQTMLTSFWFNKEGISFFSYQTPLFGPPWQVPFEFPLYQAISVLIVKLGLNDLIVASHLTSIVFFYTSALFLYLICKEFLQDKLSTLVIFSIYLWLPYTIRYSTEILIDYLSLSLALGFIYFFKKWIDDPKKIVAGLIAIFMGSMGALVKITTMAIVLVPAFLLLLSGLSHQGYRLNDLWQPKGLFKRILLQKVFWAILIATILFPLILTLLWTHHTDSIKFANPLAVWLSSSNLRDWNYGTFAQKTSLTNWWAWIKNIQDYFFFGGLFIFPLIGLIVSFKASRNTRGLLFSSLLGSFLTIFIFFNLYLHEYYYIAITAFMSILLGYGLSVCIRFYFKQKLRWSILFLIYLLIFCVLPGGMKVKINRASALLNISFYQNNIISTATAAKNITSEDGYIIAVQSDWYPELLLYSERKGLIVQNRARKLFTCEMVTRENFTTVVIPEDSLDPTEVLKCFSHVKLVEPGIYQVTNTDS